jgi:ABC-2 type transport system permease protein
MSAPEAAVPTLESPGRVTFPRVLLAEWTKFRTVRSTKWSLGVATFLVLAFPLIPAFVTLHHYNHGETVDASPLDIALVGVQIAQLVIGVLGVLTITSEYSTGSIRSTFTAVPKRLPVLWAKLIDYALVSIGLLVPTMLVSFFETQAIVDGIPHERVSLATASIARCVFMAPVYVMLVGALALALGAIARNTAAGIASFVALFFILPPLAHLALSGSVQTTTLKYLPLNAGEQMFSLNHGSDSLSPLGGGVVMVVYCAVAIVIAAVLLRRRDV